MYSKQLTALLLLIILNLTCFMMNSQTSRFNAGFVAGLNFSELEGKSVTDYFGLNAGLMGTARLTKHTQFSMEILFSQNGENILPDYYPKLEYGAIWLNHVEVPVHVDVLIGLFEHDEFYDWHLNFGMAYTRLMSYHAETIDKISVDDQIIYSNKDAMLLQVGTTYMFTKNWGLNFKTSLPIRIDGLSWTLAARAIYMIH